MEERVLDYLRAKPRSYITNISHGTGLSVEHIYDILLKLEEEGIIKKDHDYMSSYYLVIE